MSESSTLEHYPSVFFDENVWRSQVALMDEARRILHQDQRYVPTFDSWGTEPRRNVYSASYLRVMLETEAQRPMFALLASPFSQEELRELWSHVWSQSLVRPFTESIQDAQKAFAAMAEGDETFYYISKEIMAAICKGHMERIKAPFRAEVEATLGDHTALFDSQTKAFYDLHTNSNGAWTQVRDLDATWTLFTQCKARASGEVDMGEIRSQLHVPNANKKKFEALLHTLKWVYTSEEFQRSHLPYVREHLERYWPLTTCRTSLSLQEFPELQKLARMYVVAGEKARENFFEGTLLTEASVLSLKLQNASTYAYKRDYKLTSQAKCYPHLKTLYVQGDDGRYHKRRSSTDYPQWLKIARKCPNLEAIYFNTGRHPLDMDYLLDVWRKYLQRAIPKVTLTRIHTDRFDVVRHYNALEKEAASVEVAPEL